MKTIEDIKLAPSILAADFTRLGEQVAEAERAGADRIHIDIMDGHFVPNISMGAPLVQSLRTVTELRLEIHMMISDPDFFLDQFVKAGSDSFIVHWEGNNNLHRTVQRIKSLGKQAGVAINPATPASVLEDIGAGAVPRVLALNKVDLIDDERRSELTRRHREAEHLRAILASAVRSLDHASRLGQVPHHRGIGEQRGPRRRDAVGCRRHPRVLCGRLGS